MTEIMAFSGIKAIAETAELLLASRGEYQKTLDTIVESALKISGADRSCLIIENKKDELIIKAGVPRHAHGIENKIFPDRGEKFLKQVMSDKSMVLVTNPCEDRRVAYMRELVQSCAVSSILFLPLSLEGESIGILVLDWVGGKKISKDMIENIKLFRRLASTAIGMEYKGRKDREKILQDEKLRVLGEHSSQVAHIIRNSLMVIGGFSGRLLKYLSKETRSGEAGFDSEFVETLRENVEVIDNESKKLGTIVNDVLSFASFKKPFLETGNINEFLEEELKRIVLIGPRPVMKLGKRLNGLNTSFDKNMLSICIADLVRYAVGASASRIVIKTKLKPKQKEIIISIIHNGKQIHPHVMKDLFSPFVTSEIDGSGLGLANVQSIIMSHGGHVSVLSGDVTEFGITLPLIQGNGPNADDASVLTRKPRPSD
jgi:signal transduction histidine kinase